jgi:hypothetical protein
VYAQPHMHLLTRSGQHTGSWSFVCKCADSQERHGHALAVPTTCICITSALPGFIHTQGLPVVLCQGTWVQRVPTLCQRQELLPTPTGVAARP